MASHRSPPVPGSVLAVATGTRRLSAHETGSLESMSRRIAALLNRPFGGLHLLQALADAPCPSAYHVPDDTLDTGQARALGITGENQLFGGVVPHRFAATKLVSHPATGVDAAVPEGWPHALGGALADAVLPGFAVFSADEARYACGVLLRRGTARIKLARGSGGKGQALLADRAALDAFLDALPGDELARHGATLEQHLAEAGTWSVGTARCGDLRIAYVGTQRETRDRHGGAVYGGSDLEVVRGGFERLPVAPLAPGARDAVLRARRYHDAMTGSFPGFFASRCNYDVVVGNDREGRPLAGVLEQSWRIGGASPAEIAAMEAFAADPSLQRVRAACREVHGSCSPPAGAGIAYRGEDPVVGPLCKYAMVEVADGRPA